MEKRYYVYILTNNSGTLYIGVTRNLDARNTQHKDKVNKGFTEKYNISKLIYYEVYQYIGDAIMREKQLKNWNRTKKLNLIRKINPTFKEIEIVD
ncbi:MAG TPA: GIY-YIG nuclease family protein [Candidatus Saccharimonadales bacterium]|nr:GIY-YIG nuclease family protein [Candidatus Saccharimonadales bacterium]